MELWTWTWICIWISLFNCRSFCSVARGSASEALWWILRICISNKFPGDAVLSGDHYLRGGEAGNTSDCGVSPGMCTRCWKLGWWGWFWAPKAEMVRGGTQGAANTSGSLGHWVHGEWLGVRPRMQAGQIWRVSGAGYRAWTLSSGAIRGFSGKWHD